MSKRTPCHDSVDKPIDAPGQAGPALPDDVWTVILDMYKPAYPVDWLRLLGTSKHLAPRVLVRLRWWLLPLARRMQPNEFHTATGTGRVTERYRIDGVWFRFKPGGYEPPKTPFHNTRNALACYIGDLQRVNEFLANLRVRQHFVKHCALSMSELIWPFVVACSSDPMKPTVDKVLQTFNTRLCGV